MSVALTKPCNLQLFVVIKLPTSSGNWNSDAISAMEHLVRCSDGKDISY